MKKYFKILVLTICVLLVSVPVFATNMVTGTYKGLENSNFDYNPITENIAISDEIKVQLNGEYISFLDENGEKVEPQLINDRTMVPMRKIFETFGANIEWESETKSIKATTESLEIELQIGNNKATVKNLSGDVKEITLDSEPTIVDERTLVPVRFIAESLEKKVDWDKENRTVIIIDTDFISEKIKNNAQNLYEYLTMPMAQIKSTEGTMKVSAKLDYKDSDEKSNNTSLNIAGTIDFKLNEEFVDLDLNFAITGKGLLKDKIKEQGLSKLNMQAILDTNNMILYFNLPEVLVGKVYGGKWVKYALEDYDISYLKDKDELKSATSNIELIENAMLPSTLDITSYEVLNASTDIICNMFSNEHLKISGRDTKTYEYEIDLDDIFSIFGVTDDVLGNKKDDYKFKLKSITRVSDSVAKSGNLNIEFEMKQGTETVEVELETSSTIDSYNKDVTIKLPSEIVE